MGIEFDVEPHRAEWSPGEEVTGEIVVARGGDAGATTVYLRYVAHQPGVRDRVLREAVVETLRRGALADGERLPFRLALPPDALPNVGTGETRRAWSVGAKIAAASGPVHGARDIDVAAGPGAAPAQATGTAGRRLLRERLGFGGTWALAAAVLFGLAFYLLAAGILVATLGDASGGERWLLVVAGALALAAGSLGLAITVPRRAKHLDLALDFAELPAGGTVSGTLWNREPGTPVELAAVCRRTTARFGRFGESGPLGSWASQSTLAACPARVDPAAAEQRFSIDLPAEGPQSGRGGLSTTTWWVVAKVPASGRRYACVLELLDVGA